MIQEKSYSREWKDQIVMTVELAKFKSEEEDGDLSGNPKKNTNDFIRFQYDLDLAANRNKYKGGFLGGDLIGLREKSTHFKNFGVTSAIIYPFFKCDQNTVADFLPSGYAVTDWRYIDRNFRGAGQKETDLSSFTKFVEDMHNPAVGGSRLNVLMDISYSFCGGAHPWIQPLTSQEGVKHLLKWDPDQKKNNLSGDSYMMLPESLPIDLTKYFNADVFSHEFNRKDGKIGGNRASYPSEAVGNSITCSYENLDVKFNLGSKIDGEKNAIKGGWLFSKKIEIPKAKYGTIALCTASAEGVQKVGYQINYADGTNEILYVNVNSWNDRRLLPGIAMKYDHYHTPSGEKKEPAKMYCHMLSVDSTKEIESVIMKNGSGASKTYLFSITGYPVVNPIKVDLASYYNENAISGSESAASGIAGMEGVSFPSQPLTKTGKGLGPFLAADYEGKTRSFAVGPVNKNNMVSCTGQKVKIPQNTYHGFSMAAFSSDGNRPDQTFILTYADGTEEKVTLTIQDVLDSKSEAANRLFTSDHAVVNQQGTRSEEPSKKLSIYQYELPAVWNKALVSITLPNDPAIHIVSMNPIIKLDTTWGFIQLDHTYGLSDNTGNIQYFWNNLYRYWIEKAGVDGFRVDSVQGIHPDFTKKINNEFFRKNYPDKFLVGEVFVDEGNKLPWQLSNSQYMNSPGFKDLNGNSGAGLGFNGMYDFSMMAILRQTFGQDAPANAPMGLISGSIITDLSYEEPWNMMVEFDNYEADPILKLIDSRKYPAYADKLPKVKLAAAYVLTTNRVPNLFSGNEYLVHYGTDADLTKNEGKAGYLFTDEVQNNPVYQDNYRYMQALVKTRKAHPALRSKEKMTNDAWIKQDSTLFGFIRREEGASSMVVMFNNTDKAVDAFETELPDGVQGKENYNCVLKNTDGSYGGADSTVSWEDGKTLKISKMEPWEVKVLRIN